jgi:hypothetical protein
LHRQLAVLGFDVVEPYVCPHQYQPAACHGNSHQDATKMTVTVHCFNNWNQVMKIIAKQWIQLRETPGQTPYRYSYVRFDAIERISVVENEPDNEYRASVLAVVYGQEYLYAALLTIQEALKHAESLIEDIQAAKRQSQLV